MKEENKKNTVVLNLKDAITKLSGPNGLTYVLWPTPIPITPGQFYTIKWTPGERYSFINGGYYIIGDPTFRVFQVSAGYAQNGEGFGLTIYNDDAQNVLVQIWLIAFLNE